MRRYRLHSRATVDKFPSTPMPTYYLLLNSNWYQKKKRSCKPLEALTVFTDASRASCRSVMTWKDPQTQQWEMDIKYVEGSPQIAGLATAVRAFERFAKQFSLITDSACVAGVVARAEYGFSRRFQTKHFLSCSQNSFMLSPIGSILILLCI